MEKTAQPPDEQSRGGDDFARLGDLLGPAAASSAAPAESPAAVSAARAAQDHAQLAKDHAQSAKDHNEVVKDHARAARDVSRMVAFLWPEVVGPEIAPNARPTYLRGGRLVVATSSPAWAQSLQLLSEHLLRRLSERLAEMHVSAEITKLVFRHAGWEEVPPGPPVEARGLEDQAALPAALPAEALSPEQQNALAEVEQMPLPSALKEALLRAMRASFVRDKKDFVR